MTRPFLTLKLHSKVASRAWALVIAGLIAASAQAQNLPGAGSLSADARMTPIRFSDLSGWQADSLEGFWPAFVSNCQVMRQRAAPWARVCREAESVNPKEASAIRQFIELRFTPHELSDTKGTRSATITGYYEPLLKGSRTREGPYQIPLYRTPKDLINVDLSSVYPEIKALRLRGRLEGGRVVPYPTRAEIERRSLLAGQELLWVDDPVEAFFLQVQGSGRVQLANGE